MLNSQRLTRQSESRRKFETSLSEQSSRATARFNVLGIDVSAVTVADTVERILQWVTGKRAEYVCVTGVHGIMESHRDSSLKRIHNRAGLVVPDGMPLVWLGKVAGVHIDRVYGPDLLLAVCEATQGTAVRHFFYGGAEGVAELLVERLTSRFPRLNIAGTLTPPFRPLSAREDDAECDAINNAGSDIVWVGLSTPKQEHWMASHRERVSAAVLIGVGAAFDFHAGLKRQAPRWIQRSGFEWLFRLGTEPRRLWKRYLRNNPLFAYYLFLQFTGLKDFE